MGDVSVFAVKTFKREFLTISAVKRSNAEKTCHSERRFGGREESQLLGQHCIAHRLRSFGRKQRGLRMTVLESIAYFAGP